MEGLPAYRWVTCVLLWDLQAEPPSASEKFWVDKWPRLKERSLGQKGQKWVVNDGLM